MEIKNNSIISRNPIFRQLIGKTTQVDITKSSKQILFVLGKKSTQFKTYFTQNKGGISA